MLVKQCSLPIIAAGGIMDGRGIVAAMTLGAVGVQMGTAFVLCPESSANAAYREQMKSERARHTVSRPQFLVVALVACRIRCMSSSKRAHPRCRTTRSLMTPRKRCTRQPVPREIMSSRHIGPGRARRWLVSCRQRLLMSQLVQEWRAASGIE